MTRASASAGALPHTEHRLAVARELLEAKIKDNSPSSIPSASAVAALYARPATQLQSN